MYVLLGKPITVNPLPMKMEIVARYVDLSVLVNEVPKVNLKTFDIYFSSWRFIVELSIYLLLLADKLAWFLDYNPVSFLIFRMIILHHELNSKSVIIRWKQFHPCCVQMFSLIPHESNIRMCVVEFMNMNCCNSDGFINGWSAVISMLILISF